MLPPTKCLQCNRTLMEVVSMHSATPVLIVASQCSHRPCFDTLTYSDLNSSRDQFRMSHKNSQLVNMFHGPLEQPRYTGAPIVPRLKSVPGLKQAEPHSLKAHKRRKNTETQDGEREHRAEFTRTFPEIPPPPPAPVCMIPT